MASVDRELSSILDALIAGDAQRALHTASALTNRHPDFALAQLLHGELLALAALDPLQVSDHYDWSPRLMNLLLEARRRWQHGRPDDTAAEARLPAAIIQAGEQIHAFVLVDIARSELYRYHNREAEPVLTQTHYVSSGRAGAGKQLEGDLKTPIGLYRITDALIDAELPPLYGHGALVLDYPNAVDRRFGRTGHGIWLHGNPSGQTSRAPYSSEGCVTMINEHIAVLMDELPLRHTQVVLSDSLAWHTRVEAEALRSHWRRRFEHWRDAWLEGDMAQLQRLYVPAAMPTAVADRQSASASQAALSLPVMSAMAAPASDSPDRWSGLTEDDARLLTAIDVASITVLASPHAQGAAATDRHVQMTLPAAPEGSGAATVLWWRLGADQQWRIVQEERVPRTR